MSSPNFKKLEQRISDVSFSSEKLKIIKSVAKNNRFSCQQISMLIDRINFSPEKLKALEILSKKIQDPGNHYKILGMI